MVTSTGTWWWCSRKRRVFLIGLAFKFVSGSHMIISLYTLGCRASRIPLCFCCLSESTDLPAFRPWQSWYWKSDTYCQQLNHMQNHTYIEWWMLGRRRYDIIEWWIPYEKLIQAKRVPCFVCILPLIWLIFLENKFVNMRHWDVHEIDFMHDQSRENIVSITI